MKVEKVINNNVISSFGEDGVEIVIMGTGIGFGAKQGTPVNEKKIQKIFRLEDQALVKQFEELVRNMPSEYMEVSADIISHARKTLHLKLSKSIYLTLMDHIYFAVERIREGIVLQNALLWEIKRFYPQEYLVGKFALEQVRNRLGVVFPEDEAGFIALHFVNAEYDTKISDTVAMTRLIQGILGIVKEKMCMEFDEESLHYERFLTHLKFLVQRVYRNELLRDEEVEMARMLQDKYPREYACSEGIAAYIEQEQGERISSEEIMFLTVHIRRVCIQTDDE